MMDVLNVDRPARSRTGGWDVQIVRVAKPPTTLTLTSTSFCGCCYL